MLSRVSLRGGLRTRLMRVGLAWLTLLAIAFPGFAARGICCAPEVKKSSDCCAAQTQKSEMKMPGMDSSQMASMMGADADDWAVVDATPCLQSASSDLPAYILRSEASFDASALQHLNFHSGLASHLGADAPSSPTSAWTLLEGTPPRVLQADPLFVVLRI